MKIDKKRLLNLLIKLNRHIRITFKPTDKSIKLFKVFSKTFYLTFKANNFHEILRTIKLPIRNNTTTLEVIKAYLVKADNIVKHDDKAYYIFEEDDKYKVVSEDLNFKIDKKIGLASPLATLNLAIKKYRIDFNGQA